MIAYTKDDFEVARHDALYDAEGDVDFMRRVWAATVTIPATHPEAHEKDRAIAQAGLDWSNGVNNAKDPTP